MAVEEVECSGRTVEDAIRQAERDLGVSRTDLSIEIITQGRTGVFGIGAESARIRAARLQPVAPAAPETPSAIHPPLAAETSDLASRRPAEATAIDTGGAESPGESSKEIVSSANLAETAADVLRQLLGSMGFDAEVSVRSEHDPLMLAISGNNLGVLIGRRGDNLSALQFMVNLILSKNRRQWPRVVIDVENYRARREESLRSLADRIAYRVRRSQRPFTLEAMPAGDRRVIHLTLREESDIETYSIGEGVARRVVIAPKRASEGQ